MRVPREVNRPELNAETASGGSYPGRAISPLLELQLRDAGGYEKVDSPGLARELRPYTAVNPTTTDAE
jgi:hypothetical protein